MEIEPIKFTFGPSGTDAAPDVSCPKCGGTKPTCCSCPEPKEFTLTDISNEFTQAAIMAHIGYQHEAEWSQCEVSSCSERREMIAYLGRHSGC